METIRAPPTSPARAGVAETTRKTEAEVGGQKKSSSARLTYVAFIAANFGICIIRATNSASCAFCAAEFGFR